MIHSFASGWFLFINIKTNRMLALKDFSPNPVAWCGLTGGEEVDSGSALRVVTVRCSQIQTGAGGGAGSEGTKEPERHVLSTGLVLTRIQEQG